jgi:hypothetical protein
MRLLHGQRYGSLDLSLSMQCLCVYLDDLTYQTVGNHGVCHDLVGSLTVDCFFIKT